MVQNAVFFQDDWKVGHGVHIAMGCGITCRTIRRCWTAPSRGWEFCGRRRRRERGRCMRMGDCLRGGMASRRMRRCLREDGTQRVTSTVYNPVYGGPGQRVRSGDVQSVYGGDADP